MANEIHLCVISKFRVRIPSLIDSQVLLHLFQLLINVAESGLNSEGDVIKYRESGEKGGVDVKTLHELFDHSKLVVLDMNPVPIEPSSNTPANLAN